MISVLHIDFSNLKFLRCFISFLIFLPYVHQVDCALALVRLGKERAIPGLELLCDDLVTMETLVYETSCELSLTLKDLQQLSDIDKLRLLMKNVSGIICTFHIFTGRTGIMSQTSNIKLMEQKNCLNVKCHLRLYLVALHYFS